MNEYKTLQGDTWDLIAFNKLGGEQYTDRLIEANLNYREYVVFPANITLVLPEIQTPKTMILPPWKR
nr:MAG TPA: tail protein [Caudoviricetes sp.]DAQ19446.1 MAG TPA: tail protein [Caudoviricetes sp.]